ncbi:MAG: hypothetical protein AB1611_11925 [bacterium]
MGRVINSGWLLLWFLSSAWLFLMPVFGPPAPLWGAGALALAVGFGFLGFRVGRKSKPFALFFSLADSLTLCGLIFLAQAAALPLFYFLGARYHHVPLLQPLVYPLLKAAGLGISLSDGAFFVQTVDRVSKVSITLERLGFFPFLLYLAGGLMLLFATGQSRSRMVKFFLLLGGYCSARFLILLLISIDIDSQCIFWSSLITSVSFFPFILILVELLPLPARLSSLAVVYPGVGKKPFRAGSPLFLGALFLILAVGFKDPGVKKPGLLLIDEAHSEWEWTDEKFDTRLFGKRTDYNFYCLSEYLTCFYPQVKKNYQPLTRQTLTGVDVLILKTPTQEYSDEEIEAIDDFVARGGGLFLIGDHTNVFGMSTYLNKVAARFGLRFRYDVTYDLPTCQLSLYQPPAILPHPVVQHIPVFLFGSSCTLTIPLTASSVITGYGLRNHYLDYSRKNFFPVPEEDPDYEFGLFVQSAAVSYHQGRVLAYTDSTCFSNFFIFIPGKPELLLGSVEWLNRKNRYGIINFILLLAGVGCFLSLAIIWRPGRKDFLGSLLTFGLLAVVLGVSISHLLNRKNYSYPKPRRNFIQVALESEHSSSFLPVRRLAENPDHSFLTFFVWIQRLGYVPCLKPSLEEALQCGHVAVVIDPVKDFTHQEISELKQYLLRGGSLLVLDSPRNQRSTANRMLKEFGLTIDRHHIVRGRIFDQAALPLGEFDQAGQIKGGSPLLTDRQGNAVFSIKKYGAGLIAVLSASHLFQDESLGYTSSIPDEYQRWLSGIEFWIFESLARKEFRPFSLSGQWSVISGQ